MWYEGSFSSAASWEEIKSPDVNTRTQTLILTARLNRLLSNEASHCIFLLLLLVLMQPCC